MAMATRTAAAAPTPTAIFPTASSNKLHLLARRLILPHPKGGVLDVTAPLPPHMQKSF